MHSLIRTLIFSANGQNQILVYLRGLQFWSKQCDRIKEAVKYPSRAFALSWQ